MRFQTLAANIALCGCLSTDLVSAAAVPPFAFGRFKTHTWTNTPTDDSSLSVRQPVLDQPTPTVSVESSNTPNGLAKRFIFPFFFPIPQLAVALGVGAHITKKKKMEAEKKIKEMMSSASKDIVANMTPKIKTVVVTATPSPKIVTATATPLVVKTTSTSLSATTTPVSNVARPVKEFSKSMESFYTTLSSCSATHTLVAVKSWSPVPGATRPVNGTSDLVESFYTTLSGCSPTQTDVVDVRTWIAEVEPTDKPAANDMERRDTEFIYPPDHRFPGFQRYPPNRPLSLPDDQAEYAALYKALHQAQYEALYKALGASPPTGAAHVNRLNHHEDAPGGLISKLRYEKECEDKPNPAACVAFMEGGFQTKLTRRAAMATSAVPQACDIDIGLPESFSKKLTMS